MYKVLVVDDETIARNSVTILLSKRNDICQVTEAENGEVAVSLLEQEHFDIVVLDIHMPKRSGLEVAYSLCQKHIETQIIFVTAYNQHAVEAFTVNALDYLLKPFADERFHSAIDKAIRQINSEEKQAQFDKVASALDSLLSQQTDPNEKLVLKETGRIKLIDVNDIQYIKGAGNYAEIVLLSEKVLLHRETLKSIHEKLPERFSRIHKSTIVRSDLVVELSPTPKGDYWLTLSTGVSLLMSRRNRDLLDTWI